MASGTCTAICPAAEFYDYQPRKIVDILQNRDDGQIEELLKSETIWYCGECMSCVTRCSRGNAPGLLITVLRSLSQEMGYFTEQGPIWEWEHEHITEVMERLGANYQKTGPWILRKIPQDDLDEIQRIFDETGATERFRKIEEFSTVKALEMVLGLNETLDNDYIRHIYTSTHKKHTKES